MGVIINAEKPNNPNIGAADANKLSIGTTDLKEADGAETEKVNKSNTGTADLTEANKVNINRTDKSGIGIVDLTKADGTNIE